MTELHVGERLYGLGWRQGSLFSAASARMIWLARQVASSEWELQQHGLDPADYLLVVTQTCDLTRAPESEPYVEVIRAYWTADKAIIHEASFNSIRRFLLRRRQPPSGSAEGLVADATTRIQTDKHALLGIDPQVGVDEQEVILHSRLRRWLAQRYGRRAIQDSYVRAIQAPVVDSIRKLDSTSPLRGILDGIREIRYVVHGDGPPFDVEMWLIREEESQSVPAVSDEDAATLAGEIAGWLEKRGLARIIYSNTYDLNEISARDYLLANPLPLEHYSDIEDPDQPTRII